MRSRFVEKTAQNGGRVCNGEATEVQACGTTACGNDEIGWLSLYFNCILIFQFAMNFAIFRLIVVYE